MKIDGEERINQKILHILLISQPEKICQRWFNNQNEHAEITFQLRCILTEELQFKPTVNYLIFNCVKTH